MIGMRQDLTFLFSKEEGETLETDTFAEDNRCKASGETQISSFICLVFAKENGRFLRVEINLCY